ncbi:MAG: hypothetical protein U5O39_09075 [Gammaproteobacteria bacterium]|nr:hypothetical protein [Gammaproteobacteria bacterium]
MDLPGTSNDCAIDDDVFVAFGESFALPEDFTLQATIDSVPDSPTSDPVFTVNVSPASISLLDSRRDKPPAPD